MKKTIIYSNPMRKVFIKSTAGAAMAAKLGFEVHPGQRVHYCSCGCGGVLGTEAGYVFTTSAPRSQLQEMGLLVSSVKFRGIY